MKRTILARTGRIVNSLVIGALLLMAGLATPASAQFAGVAPVYQAWAPSGHAALSVTATSGNVALPTIGPVARICNTGTKDAFLAFGTDNTVMALTSGWYSPAGKCATFSIKPYSTQFTYVAAITGGSDTTSLIIETGLGSPGGN